MEDKLLRYAFFGKKPDQAIDQATPRPLEIWGNLF